MKVRVFGYRIEHENFPTAMQRTDVYEAMAASPGGSIGKYYRCGAIKVKLPGPGHTQEWWAGLVLRIRDSKAFFTLTEGGGQAVLTAEHLAEGKKLAEASFFLAHPETGAAVFTHHYQSASLGNLDYLLRRVFVQECRAKKNAQLEATGRISKEEREEIKEGYKGVFMLSQTCNTNDLKELVARLKKVSSYSLKLSALPLKERKLIPILERSTSQTITFQFPPEADVEELAETLDDAREIKGLERLDVYGTSQQGHARHYGLKDNGIIFDEFDYDTVMSGLKLDLTNWDASIRTSGPIAALGRVTQSRNIFALLTRDPT